MPIITRFNGIVVRMYYEQSEHNPPHIHIGYGEYAAEIEIETGEILAGFLPVRIYTSVSKWLAIYRSELLKMWETQQFHTLPPLA